MLRRGRGGESGGAGLEEPGRHRQREWPRTWTRRRRRRRIAGKEPREERRKPASRAAIELNKEIPGAPVRRTCALASRRKSLFNHVNVSTAFRKLLLAGARECRTVECRTR